VKFSLVLVSPLEKPGIERVQACKNLRANILRSLFVARTPPVEVRSPDCRSDVENAPVGGGPAARPAGRSHYVVISRDGRKLVTRVYVVAIATQPVPRLQIRPIAHN